jgi:type IV pilus assembly protein PilE
METDTVMEPAVRSIDAMQSARRDGGFTLIEVAIAMTIIAILAAIAIPAYTQYIVRGHRSEARGSLMLAAQWMERWRTERGSYLDGGNPPPLPVTVSPPTGTPMYTIALANTTNATYTLEATPVGSMANDPCGRLQLNNRGVRNQTGTADPNLCWGR